MAIESRPKRIQFHLNDHRARLDAIEQTTRRTRVKVHSSSVPIRKVSRGPGAETRAKWNHSKVGGCAEDLIAGTVATVGPLNRGTVFRLQRRRRPNTVDLNRVTNGRKRRPRISAIAIPFRDGTRTSCLIKQTKAADGSHLAGSKFNFAGTEPDYAA